VGLQKQQVHHHNVTRFYYQTESWFGSYTAIFDVTINTLSLGLGDSSCSRYFSWGPPCWWHNLDRLTAVTLLQKFLQKLLHSSLSIKKTVVTLFRLQDTWVFLHFWLKNRWHQCKNHIRYLLDKYHKTVMIRQ